jgi:uncharacterized protein (DUF169 family)
MTAGKELQELLGLARAPVAVTFGDAPPAGIPRTAEAAPSGCTYWKQAAEGRTFYTEAADHYNCPVGAYTHGIDLPPERQSELEGLIGTMVGLAYLDPEEVPLIPRREAPFGAAVYAPLDEAAGDPDVVLVRGNARQIMLLAEAAAAAGVGAGSGVEMMGRPTCAAIPAVLGSGRCVASLGCIGNRVYTELGDDELYFAIPGRHVGAVVEKLAGIRRANDELERFHRGRL